ncbi:hypothetical protein Lokhon_01804 [Limimaricola hongkongensis DSM 17492]|uniref:Uncharacterized protein n=1 Tax=Limimaricola hongkongensis DSM 17492 TaxID=1122180 RepID=A0A017HD62_9RHOB|nr:hypothetical protein Lokhon_01804 [Limimaricola hongkongensis DSM 17492]
MTRASACLRPLGAVTGSPACCARCIAVLPWPARGPVHARQPPLGRRAGVRSTVSVETGLVRRRCRGTPSQRWRKIRPGGRAKRRPVPTYIAALVHMTQ